MANVTIVFAKGVKKPVVAGDPEGVLSGGPITWHIHTQKRAIRSVKLAFKRGDFFAGANGGPNECARNRVAILPERTLRGATSRLVPRQIRRPRPPRCERVYQIPRSSARNERSAIGCSSCAA